ncbi:hypothetical protein C4D60_Mb06t35830 [Musa balbisiana]|uniref:Uncharacterized protein n=1 Tax=Musa balbisiana TaxID=52838 RepID=A0A4S8IT27_MUSBA|nr:hypothetical protein C4D60_Mb06t35830 [Musa balbisiana]
MRSRPSMNGGRLEGTKLLSTSGVRKRIELESQNNQIKEKGKRPWKTQSKWGSGPTAMRRNTLSTTFIGRLYI